MKSESFQVSSDSVVRMSIVPVKVNVKGQDKKVLTYAFLDSGSNTSFSTEDLLKKLNAKGERATLSLTTMEKSNETIECSLVNLEVSDIGNQNLIELPMVYSRPSLPVSTAAIGNTAAKRLRMRQLEHFGLFFSHTLQSDQSPPRALAFILCAACGSVVLLHAVFDYFVVIEISLMDNQAQITETIIRLDSEKVR